MGDMKQNVGDSDELVDSFSEVVDNVRQFNHDVSIDATLSSRLNRFRSWYYIPELDLFGPSKFIGYKWMNSPEYRAGYAVSGEATERALLKFFRPLRPSSPDWQRLESALVAFCAEHGTRPNRSHRINVPR